jgi:uncharacterized membrane protein YvbJ
MRGINTASCEKCGVQLPQDALFCPRCGIRTPKGRRENAKPPWEDVLADVREDIDKAVSAAFKEVEKGLETAKQEIGRATSKRMVVCPACGEASSAGARFCRGCGKKL